MNKTCNIDIFYPEPKVSIQEKGKQFIKLKVDWWAFNEDLGRTAYRNTSFPVIRKLLSEEGRIVYSYEDAKPVDLWRYHFEDLQKMLWNFELHKVSGLQKAIRRLKHSPLHLFQPYTTRKGRRMGENDQKELWSDVWNKVKTHNPEANIFNIKRH